jgi:hypothetical protein
MLGPKLLALPRERREPLFCRERGQKGFEDHFEVEREKLGRVLINRPAMSAFGQTGHLSGHRRMTAFDPTRT